MTIKEIRETTGLSQAKFANLLEIPKRNIENWEEGKNKPAPYLVNLIEKVLRYEKILKELGYETSSDKGNATTE